MDQTTTNPSKKERVFYYYPGVSNKKPRRIALAGIVKGNQILVAESVTYPGRNPTKVAEELIETEFGPAVRFTYLLDGKDPDVFNKKRGSQIALDRARGYSFNYKGKLPFNNIEGSFTAKDGKKTFLERVPCKQTLSMVIEIPEGEQFVGKLFVAEVTKKYIPKAKPTKLVSLTPNAAPVPNDGPGNAA